MKKQEGEQRELCEQQIRMCFSGEVNLCHLHMMQMAKTSTLESNFYMLALMFKSTLQKQND